MNRRQLFALPLFLAAAAGSQRPRAIRRHLRVNFILDLACRPRVSDIRYLHDVMWTEAVKDLAKLGVTVEIVGRGEGLIRRPPDAAPVFEGLERGAINIVVTRRIPMQWDRGLGLKGVAFRAYGYDVCVLALENAHAFRFPYLANNTCVHELLHFVLGDVEGEKPKGLAGELCELRIEAIATDLHFRPPASLLSQDTYTA